MSAIAQRPLSLFDLEEELQALLDTAELVAPEQQEEFQRELSAALQRSVEKRDRVAQFITHCCYQQGNCDEEIERLQKRKRTFKLAEKRIRQYVQSVIEALGTDQQGRYRQLEGKTATFSLRAKPPSIEITSEDAVPDEYKRITVTMALSQWRALLTHAEIDLVEVTDAACITMSKSAIREAIDGGAEVPGADLNIGGNTLTIK